MKKIVIINGSPRRNGNTGILVDSFITGAQSAGHDVTVINSAEKNIHPCMGCNFCHKNDEHKCAFNDDMTECYSILSEADVIAIATPVYFYNVSAQLKCLIDRLHNPIRKNFKVKKLVLLSVCADTIPSVFDSIKTMYKSVLKYFSLEDGGMVTVSGVSEKGDIICHPMLEDARMTGLNI